MSNQSYGDGGTGELLKYLLNSGINIRETLYLAVEWTLGTSVLSARLLNDLNLCFHDYVGFCVYVCVHLLSPYCTFTQTLSLYGYLLISRSGVVKVEINTVAKLTFNTCVFLRLKTTFFAFFSFLCGFLYRNVRNVIYHTCNIIYP